MIARLHWFTSDLRLRDNPALTRGGAEEPVAGVFVFDPRSLARAAGAPRRVAFLRACLAALDTELVARGSRLLVCTGDPAVELPRIAAALGARSVSHARNYEPAAGVRERRAAAALAAAGVDVHATDASSIHPPGAIVRDGGGPLVVYGAFARRWMGAPIRDAVAMPSRWAPVAELGDVVQTEPLAVDPHLPLAGEDAARARLAGFLRDGIADYAARRDEPAAEATSRLSYHFRFGTLSAAEAARHARQAAEDPSRRTGALKWLSELAWRDFFTHLLRAFPRLGRAPFRPLPIRWRRDERALRRWKDGTTGFPLVDAGMRELAATGWMHNRARLVASSFLTRHLLLDWRDGERHFMLLLLDAQLSQNDGNWQWVAGTGADAQPFYRIFSPVRQGERFDPDGTYVRRWVPELRRVPATSVHSPWTLTREERRALCPDYPAPIVDLDETRARALAAFAAASERRARGTRSSRKRG
jgi:deoxyribodipyrimidine photo-lyase